jgi:hypothetical protein
MNTTKLTAVVALIVLVTFTGLACSTNTKFVSDPPGAKVYINGEFIGETPCDFNSSTGLPERYHIQLFKDGYSQLNVYIDAEMSLVWALLVVPVTFGVAIPWSWTLENMYKFKLAAADAPAEPSAPAPTAPPAAAPPAPEPPPPPAPPAAEEPPPPAKRPPPPSNP